MKMGQTECSISSAHKIQTQRNHTKGRIQNTEHSKSLKSRKRAVYVLGLFFDLSMGYDVINHEILLTKLEYYGIRGAIEAWIKSYLSYCSQFVEIS